MSQFSSTDELTSFAAVVADQYEIEQEIGRGGMGVVYLARDLRLDRHVAIKTLPPHLAGDPTVRERFLREARTAARLSHPNIVPVHRADEIGGQVFFVMGCVDGASLAERLASGPMSPRDTVPILRDVAAALGYAHRQGIIHRDVKTENILIDAATGRALVTDFGIARVTEAAPLTATGQVLGTVYYLSPEQVSGDDVDSRSDIYSLGVVGYAMLAGRFPFDGTLASAVLVAHVTKQATPMSAVAPHVPASLATIIDRCLAKDPGHRFQDCAQLEAALAAAEADASRVATAVKVPSPLISDSEAHAVFRRAAELQEQTGIIPRPAPVAAPRDQQRDAQRKSGFRTGNLREAAVEAGIDARYVEHAFAERGLTRLPEQPRTADAPEVVVRDFSGKPGFWRGQPSDLSYEVALDGEMAERDFDLLVDIIRRATGEVGQTETVGSALTWISDPKNGRYLQISVFPRNGRTTIRLSESLRPTLRARYSTSVGGIGGIGGGAAFMFSLFTTHSWTYVERFGRFRNEVTDLSDHLFWGSAAWIAIAAIAHGIARTMGNTTSESRQAELKTLIERLGDQARESIEAKNRGRQ